MITDSQLALLRLGACEAAAAIREGRTTSCELVESYLACIEEREKEVQSWAYLDREYALQQARAADDARQRGQPTGPLHGVPVGIKDTIDTYDMPTENGTVLHAGRRPHRDATAVAALREAGGVILGKTVTSESAAGAPGKTRNPHDRTPGGSSSGSAAAVAARMVPLALGTQVNGSIICPASYCGVIGYKPTRGLISRTGILRQSPTLDGAGVFAQTVEDAALVAETLMTFDASDDAMRPQARPRLHEFAGTQLPFPPRFAFVPTSFWEQTAPDTRAGFAELTKLLEHQLLRVELPEPFAEAVELHRILLETDLALAFRVEDESASRQLSPALVEMIERGRKELAVDYARALAAIPMLHSAVESVLHDAHVILTPAVPGEAPRQAATIGDSIFSTIWALCGVPCITVPLLRGEHGMPIGVQLVGARGDDARLLQVAQWLMHRASGAPRRSRRFQ
jgi:Asp-tRNA(Asn)/Glu-tRNA(Gln) amidotransferase A subunit family amidase